MFYPVPFARRDRFSTAGPKTLLSPAKFRLSALWAHTPGVSGAPSIQGVGGAERSFNERHIVVSNQASHHENILSACRSSIHRIRSDCGGCHH
ncbi:hypothetical protein AGR4B_pAt20460 [Agrobacterium tumefaciens str. CFBP 5621]|nr:hypothetical protein AGR4B_pAt20460 [Agrobacterium tumefaciens str. CFBP 5621]